MTKVSFEIDGQKYAVKTADISYVAARRIKIKRWDYEPRFLLRDKAIEKLVVEYALDIKYASRRNEDITIFSENKEEIEAAFDLLEMAI